ncbi:MAG TPA: hypothetical protein ENN69_09025 [Spirochaetia bacterium]|nr:hypothetical protein [Spirochaetia bacterium]
MREIWKELSDSRREERFLLREFRRRLPDTLTNAVRRQSGSLFAEIVTAEKLKELIYYVLHQFDSILIRHEERAVHKERIEGYGSTLAIVYAAIMQCVNEVKAEYVSGSLSRRGAFGRARRGR